MLFLIKFALTFVFSFAILSIPVKEKTVFVHLSEVTHPLFQKAWGAVSPHIGDSLKEKTFELSNGAIGSRSTADDNTELSAIDSVELEDSALFKKIGSPGTEGVKKSAGKKPDPKKGKPPADTYSAKDREALKRALR